MRIWQKGENTMTHDEMISVIQHHKNGGKVECKHMDNRKWENAASPLWNFNMFSYRAKPEPLTLNVIYDETMKRVVTFESATGPIGDLLDMNERQYPSLKFSIKKFVEVAE